MNTQKEIKLKSGITLPKGLPVTFNKQKPWLCYVLNPGTGTHCVRVKSAFKVPGTKALYTYVDSGSCKAISGLKTEPDGWCAKDTPSWLLALGMI